MDHKTTSRAVQAAIVVLFAGIVASAQLAHAGLAPEDAPVSGIVERDAVEVGDVVATGTPALGGCILPVFGVRATLPPGETPGQWTAVRVEPDCAVVVSAKWEGALEDGPRDLRVVQAALAALLGGSPGKAVKETDDGDASSVPRPVGDDHVPVGGIVPQACETSEQHVFNYGYGGTWDSLTHKNGIITFCYTGSSVTTSSQSGTCQGSNPAWWYSWVVDSCTTTSINNGPSNIVWRTGKGTYHCEAPGTFPCNSSSPDGYYHSLFDDEDGHSDGVSHCTYWSDGQTVAGVSREVLQGCS